VFKRHESAGRIGAALELLSRRGHVERQHQPGENGRPAEVWKAAHCEISERSERRS
jgi:predicted ArsR family transcriptional regulator